MTRKGRKIYLLLEGGKIEGAWTNLKQLCEDMQMETNKGFASYSKLAKLPKESGEIEIVGKNKKEYKIYILVLR